MGEHRLKGLVDPEHLWQMVVPGLLIKFAPLQTFNATPNNLPGYSPVCRTRAWSSRSQTPARRTRMVTLIGPGGTGKTRLALQAATDLLDEYEDRVYLVDLAPSRDPEPALAAIARTVGLREKSDKPLLEDLKSQIKQRKMLLLLDNFEQVTVPRPPWRNCCVIVLNSKCWSPAAKRCTCAARMFFPSRLSRCRKSKPSIRPWNNSRNAKRYSCLSSAPSGKTRFSIDG